MGDSFAEPIQRISLGTPKASPEYRARQRHGRFLNDDSFHTLTRSLDDATHDIHAPATGHARRHAGAAAAAAASRARRADDSVDAAEGRSRQATTLAAIISAKKKRAARMPMARRGAEHIRPRYLCGADVPACRRRHAR